MRSGEWRLWVIGLIAWTLGEAPGRTDDAALAVHAETILKTYCQGCHGPGGKAKGGFNYVLDRDKLVATKRLVPGQPAASELFEVIRDGTMPPPKETMRPSKDEVALLQKWITAGAPVAPRTAAPRTFLTEAELQRLILADLQAVAPLERRFVRYLSLANGANAGWSDSELEAGRLALVKLLNSLSWHPRLHVPRAIDAGKTLFRIDLRELKWTTRLYDRIVAFYPYRLPTTSSDARAIAAATGCEAPYLRADWFIATASRAPLYYDLLELPTTDRGLERLLQVDAARNIEELSVVRAGFNGSGVSSNNRLIERHDAAHGAYWKTYDFSANTEKQNLFEHPLGPPPAGNGFVHAGGEMIFHLPNGLLAFFVADASGRRIDRAPVEIVSDPQRPDKTVEAGLSCFACHAAGFIPKSDQVRAHVSKNAQAFARADLEAIQALFPADARVRALVAEDSQRYLQALEKLGLKKDTVEPVAALALRYESTVDLRAAAAEAGWKPAGFADQLRRSSTLSRSLGALQAPGGTVQRQTFIAAFPELMRELQPTDTAITSTTTESSQAFAGHTAAIQAIAVSPDGRLALSGGDDRSIRLWDIATGREIRRLDGHRAAVTALAFSPDGRQAVSGSHDRTVRLWDVQTGNELHILTGHTDPITCVAFSADGRRLLSGSQDRTLLWWNAETGQELRAFTGHAGRISSVAISPDGKLAVSGGHDRTVRLWDVKTGRAVRVIGGLGEIYSVAFSPDGSVIAAGGNERVVRLWAVADGQELRRLDGHANAIIRVAFADGQTVLTASSQYQSPDRTIRIWDARTGQEKRSLAGPERDRVSCAAFAPSGTVVLTDAAEPVLRRWNLE